MTPHIRHFTPADRPLLVQAIDLVCAEGRWMSTSRFEPDRAWALALRQSRRAGYLLLVVEDGGQVVGWCRAFPGLGQEAVLGVGLLPAYRDRGLGTALVRRALRWARGSGYRRINLATRSDNARAIHLFRHCGFDRVGRADDGLLEMACVLPPSRGSQGDYGHERFPVQAATNGPF